MATMKRSELNQMLDPEYFFWATGIEDTFITAPHAVTGRTLDVFTTEPGLQLYSGNQLDHIGGKGGRSYGRHSGLCLETQHFPDSPNQPRFPSTILRPGARFESRTVLAFGIEG